MKLKSKKKESGRANLDDLLKELREISQEKEELAERERVIRALLVQHLQETEQINYKNDVGSVSLVTKTKTTYNFDGIKSAIGDQKFSELLTTSVDVGLLEAQIRSGDIEWDSIDEFVNVEPLPAHVQFRIAR